MGGESVSRYCDFFNSEFQGWGKWGWGGESGGLVGVGWGVVTWLGQREWDGGQGAAA
jgi:hypothetical protein